MRGLILLLLCTVSLTCCIRSGTSDTKPEKDDDFTYPTYAKGFNLIDFKDYKLIRVFNPWQNSNDVTFTYILGENKALVPDSLEDYTFIQTPVRRVITLSTTHLAMVSQLGMQETIIGVSGSGLIYDSTLSAKVNAGQLHDIGYDQGLNYETIISLDPDVLFMYGVEGSVIGISEKLKELGIPVVFCGEYLETHPLGKSEWIRFFSQFFGKEKESDLFFNRIDSIYQSLAKLTANLNNRPSVLLGLPWNDAWYVAGGESYSVKLVEDAGGDYLWSENRTAEAIPMDIEAVYVRALGADFWINPGAANSLEELSLFDERFMDLPALQHGMVFNNNARMGEKGGNDYWESGTVRPDLILADLITIFHPRLLPDHKPIYYRKLK